MKRIPLWVYILLLGIVTFYTYEIQIASDMIWYMNAALNISQGKGYTAMDGSLALSRGPIFPFLIATSYKLLGASPWSAFWVVRIFCILNPLVIYLLGKKLYNKWVGFVAGLFILTSYSVNFWSYRHIDAVWPFFAIFGSYLTLCGFENKKLRYFFLSGLSFGIAILTKEVSLLFLPIPLLLFLCTKEYRNKGQSYGVIVNTLSAVVILLPWLYFLQGHGGLKLLMGQAGMRAWEDIAVTSSSASVSDFSSLIDCIFGYMSGSIKYFYGGRHSLFTNITIAPVFLIAWIFISLRSLVDKNSKILLLYCLPIFPVLIVVGKNDWRLGQGIYFLLISYLALAVLISWLVEIVSAYAPLGARWSTVAGVALCSGIIVVQVFGGTKRDLGYKTNFKYSHLYNLLQGKVNSKRIAGPFGEANLNKAIQKLADISTPGEHVLVDWSFAAETAYYKLGGENIVISMPFVWWGNDSVYLGVLPANLNEKPIYIDATNLNPDYQFFLLALFESQLIDLLKTRNIRHVLLTPRHQMLSEYFTWSGYFEEVENIVSTRNPKNRYRIYRVLNPRNLKDPRLPLVGWRLKKAMSTVKRKDIKRYEYLRTKYFDQLASLTPAEFNTIFAAAN
jgi:4-amino-4-deoxy-L-arabinose transferase-like glycosyltransferase